MFKKILTVLVAMALVPSVGYAREPVSVAGWDIIPDEEKQACNMFSLYTYRKSGEIAAFLITYSAKDKVASITFSNPYATSIKDETELELLMVFTSPNKLDDAWGNRNFFVLVDEKTGHRYFNSGWYDLELLSDITKSTYIAFFIPDSEELVSSFKLDGSARAIVELKKCAFEVAGLNPNDPFLK